MSNVISWPMSHRHSVLSSRRVMLPKWRGENGEGVIEEQREEWKPMAHVSTLENYRFSITTSPQPATPLYPQWQYTCEGHA